MFQYFVFLIFILSVAMAAGGVVLTSRLRSMYHHNILSTLLYFQVFIFTFGFYGIWGQVVINIFLSEYLSAGLLSRITDISMLLGLPFLVFAWLMLVQFSCGISGRKSNNWVVFWFLLINFSIIIVVGYLISRTSEVRPVSLIKSYFIGMSFTYSILSSILIFFPGRSKTIIFSRDRRIISLAIIIIMVLQCTPLLFYKSQVEIATIFIFTFFAGNTFLPIYLSYGARLSALSTEPLKDISFEEFCRKFEVSPRETDIVREIYNGLSNKEISERLFISLQTVKDHTHRIYIKTNVRSRVQLINLVKDVINS